MASEIAILRLASVPERLVEEVRLHAIGCPVCRLPGGGRMETRACSTARTMVERCVSFISYLSGLQREKRP